MHIQYSACTTPFIFLLNFASALFLIPNISFFFSNHLSSHFTCKWRNFQMQFDATIIPPGEYHFHGKVSLEVLLDKEYKMPSARNHLHHWLRWHTSQVLVKALVLHRRLMLLFLSCILFSMPWKAQSCRRNCNVCFKH